MTFAMRKLALPAIELNVFRSNLAMSRRSINRQEIRAVVYPHVVPAMIVTFSFTAPKTKRMIGNTMLGIVTVF